jgi:hypothetical protein
MMNSATRILAVATISLFVSLAGCEQSTRDVGQVVKTSMQEKFDSDADFSKYHLTVVSVDVVRQSGNTYQGLAHVTCKGTTHDVSVDITADGSNVLWKAPPGSFLFVAQDEFKELEQKLHQ